MEELFIRTKNLIVFVDCWRINRFDCKTRFECVSGEFLCTVV